MGEVTEHELRDEQAGGRRCEPEHGTEMMAEAVLGELGERQSGKRRGGIAGEHEHYRAGQPHAVDTESKHDQESACTQDTPCAPPARFPWVAVNRLAWR